MRRYRIDSDETAKEHLAGEWVDAHDAAEIQRQLDVARTELADLQAKLDTATASGVWLLEAAVKMQRQLNEMTSERDQYRYAADLAARLRAREARRQDRSKR